MAEQALQGGNQPQAEGIAWDVRVVRLPRWRHQMIWTRTGAATLATPAAISAISRRISLRLRAGGQSPPASSRRACGRACDNERPNRRRHPL